MGAVCVVMQHYTVHGGIESCAYSLVEGLNVRGIVPVLLGRLNDPSEEEQAFRSISERFGRSLDFVFTPLWVDRFRKQSPWAKFTQDPSPFLALQLPFMGYEFVFDFTPPLPLRVPRGRYVKYWNYFPGAEDWTLYPERGNTHGRISRRKLAPVLDAFRRRALVKGYPIFLNSHYAAESASIAIGRRLPVLYPPVSVRRFWCSDGRRRSGIVSFGRFAPYKRQLDLAELAARLADNGFSEPFTVIGGTESFPSYYEAVREKVRSLGLANVRLVPNPRFETVVETLRSSALYLHMTMNEPFGITTAEAMAAGCVPLVHDSGGQREIVPFPDLRWTSIEELERKIRDFVARPEELDRLRLTCQRHVVQFSEERFQDALVGFLAGRDATPRRSPT